MMFLLIASLALAAPAGPASSAGMPVTTPVVRVAADSDAVLTADALNKLTTFWTAWMKQSTDIRETGRKAHQKPLTVSTGVSAQPTVQLTAVVDMVAMASAYPSVAADLKTAGLTAQQWEEYRAALLGAWVGLQMSKGNGVAANTAGKNVEFLKTHDKELSALKASKMWLPQMQGGGMGGGMGMGMGGGDLDP